MLVPDLENPWKGGRQEPKKLFLICSSVFNALFDVHIKTTSNLPYHTHLKEIWIASSKSSILCCSRGLSQSLFVSLLLRVNKLLFLAFFSTWNITQELLNPVWGRKECTFECRSIKETSFYVHKGITHTSVSIREIGFHFISTLPVHLIEWYMWEGNLEFL